MRRKSDYLLIVLSAIIIAATPIIMAKEMPRQPSIKADHLYWDYGYIPFDYDMVHFFPIKNTGDANLIISKVGSNCDCTTTSIEDTLLKPGEETMIRIDFWTTDYYGTNVREVGVESNDPLNPLLILEYNSVIGALPAKYTVEPKSLFYLPAHNEKKVAFHNRSDNEVEYTITPEPDKILIFPEGSLSGRIPAGGNVDLTIKIGENAFKGNTFTSFNVQFTGDQPIRTTVPVKIARY